MRARGSTCGGGLEGSITAVHGRPRFWAIRCGALEELLRPRRADGRAPVDARARDGRHGQQRQAAIRAGEVRGLFDRREAPARTVHAAQNVREQAVGGGHGGGGGGGAGGAILLRLCCSCLGHEHKV